MKKHWLFLISIILIAMIPSICTGNLQSSSQSKSSGAVSQAATKPPGGSQESKVPKQSTVQIPTTAGIIRPLPGTAPKDTGKSVIQQVGLIVNSEQAYEGYTLLAPKHFTDTYLLDNKGNIVNSWKSDYLPGQSVYLLDNGNLLRSCFTKNQAFIGGGEGGGLQEFDWEGNLVWEFWYSNDKYLMHHDIKPLPNGNVLALAVEKKTLEECIAAGFQSSALKEKMLYPDTVIEIRPTGPQNGEIVWEWHVWDHLIQDESPMMANYGNTKEHSELIDVQCNGGRETVAFWNHMNSIDYNPELD